jgi:hypothetical protein
MFVESRSLIGAMAGLAAVTILVGFASTVCAMKPVPRSDGECFHLKSQYTQYWKAYQQALENSKRTRDPARRERYVQHAQYCRQQAGYFRHQYEQKCLRKPHQEPVEVREPQPSTPRGEWTCWSSMGRNGFCRKNGCHPQECYWLNSVTQETRYDHRPIPPGGWKP